MTAEGGRDAAMEVPFIYIALDQLALRAGSYAERRQRALISALPPAEADSALTPETAGAVAAREVKQVRPYMGILSNRGGLPC